MSARRSSSAPTPRPRKIAGRDRATPATEPVESEADDSGLVTGSRDARSARSSTTDAPSSTSGDAEVEEATEVEEPTEVEEVALQPSRGRSGEPEPEPEPEPDLEPAGTGYGFASSEKTTRVLLVVLAVLAVAALVGGGYLWWQGRDDGGGAGGGPEATDEAPVRVTVLDAQGAASAAAEAAQTIISTSWQDYDDQVAEAQDLMTPEFATKQFLPTARDAENDIIKTKTEVQVEVKGIGVRRADTERVEALIFLDQLVTKDGKEPLLSPYRLLVTLERTDNGWLVSSLDSK